MSEWKTAPLGELVKILKGSQVNTDTLQITGQYPVINGGIGPSGYFEKWNCKADTITISEGGNSCGFVNWMRTNFWSGGHCYSLHHIVIEDLFIYHALKYQEPQIMKMRVGSGLPNIQKKDLESFKISYPTSRPEQRKIARILSTVDSVIERTEAAIAKYTAIKQGMMHDLFTRGIVLKTGKLRPKYEDAPELYRKAELGWVPKDWEEGSLLKCTTKIVDRDHYTPKYLESGIPMISPKDIDENEETCFENCAFVSKEEHEHNKKKTDIKPRDLIFTRIGSLLGKVCLVTPAMPEFSILHSASMIRANLTVIEPEYLCYFMKSPFFQRQIACEIQSIGVPDLGLDKIGSFKIVYPNQTKEQQAIALGLNSLFDLLKTEREIMKKFLWLKLALMSVLLTGRKRVKYTEETTEAS